MIVAHSLRAEYDGSEDGTGRGTPLIPATFSTPAIGEIVADDVASTIQRNTGGGGETQNPAFVLDVAGTLTTRLANNAMGAPGIDGGHYLAWPAQVASTLNAAFGDKQGLEDQHALNGAPLFVPAIMSSGQANASVSIGVAPALDCLHEAPIGFVQNPGSSVNASGPTLMQAMKVRRLTPLECERLQGFPDGWTEVPYRGKPAADGPRYKALGNSMAVNCMSWIGDRIQQSVERNGG